MFKCAMIAGREYNGHYKDLHIGDLIDLVGHQYGKRVREIVERGKVGHDFAAYAYAKLHGLRLHTYPHEWRKYGNGSHSISISRIHEEQKPDVWIYIADSGPLGNEIRRAEQLNLSPVMTARKQGDIWVLYNGLAKEYLDTSTEDTKT